MPSAIRRLAAAVTGLVGAAVHAGAQAPHDLPFAPGERLELAGYVRNSVSGGGTMWVEGPHELRGTPTWVLHSDMEARVGPFRATDRSASWLDPARMTALRYATHERHILTRHDEEVEIFGGERRWQADDGTEGTMSSHVPLDELSFLYYLRTLPLPADATITVSRHYDAARNPTAVRVLGREKVDVPAGRFRAIAVEMQVRDTRRYKGEGTIRVHLSDDRCRLILRLESRVPGEGAAMLELQSYAGAVAACEAALP